MRVANSCLSGFRSLLFAMLMESEDRTDEKFLILGEQAPRKPVGFLKGARFIERLFRGHIPFVLLWTQDLDSQNMHRMCHTVYEPHVDQWEDILESSNIDFILLNRLAVEKLPINPYADPLEYDEIMKWRKEHNLYLYLYSETN